MSGYKMNLESNMIVCFDLDNTICSTDEDLPIPERYIKSTVKPHMRDVVQRMYTRGHTIIIDTARSSGYTGINKYWKRLVMRRLTRKQLNELNVPYHTLRVGTKFPADLYIDDKSITPAIFETKQ